MKRHIFLLLFALIGMSVMAQYSNPGVENEPIDIRGSRVFVDGFKLDKYNAAACFSSIDGVDWSAEYLKYRAGYKTGLGLTIGGAALMPVGYGMFLGGFIWAWNAETTAGCIAGEAVMLLGAGSIVAGGLCVLAGIPTLCVYRTRLNRLEKKYNTSLSVGSSPGGLSMAISF
jgi:hypothetical protein